MKSGAVIWYVAAGYSLPAGIEAYLLHYATEMKRRGFRPEIIVFEPFPKTPHRFLQALYDRGIPIRSLYAEVAWQARLLTALLYIAWMINHGWGKGRGEPPRRYASGRRVDTNQHEFERLASGDGCVNRRELHSAPISTTGGLNGEVGRIETADRRPQTTDDKSPTSELKGTDDTGPVSPITNNASQLTPCKGLQSAVSSLPSQRHGLQSFHYYVLKRLAVRRLERIIRQERPDVIHVKGRVIAEAFPVFPSDRTVYQHALMGTVDPSWEPAEVEAFRTFLGRIAKIFVQGKSIAETMKREFGLDREIDVIPTMAPDEAGAFAQTADATSGGVNHEWTRIDTNGDGADGDGCVNDRGTTPLACQVLPSAIFATGSSNENAQTADFRPRITDDRQPTSDLRPRTAGCRSGAKLRFGILCRFTEQKGIKYILEALRVFRDRYGDVHFTFAGTGSLQGMIESFAAQHGLVHVRIVPVDSAVAVLREMDVFVHPGLDDAMPVSIVEALMCGVPVITTDVGGCPDLVRTGKEGVIISPCSSDEIAESMMMFSELSDEELRGYRLQARERYESTCRPEVVGDTVERCYREVMGGRRPEVRDQRPDDGDRQSGIRRHRLEVKGHRMSING